VTGEHLSHIDVDGKVHMVDISNKASTVRIAEAEATILMSADTLSILTTGPTPKGDVLSTARIAGIMATKRTSDIIPLCHPLPISSINLNFILIDEPPSVQIKTSIKTNGQTGVEMEALTAASVAALTIYDMLKGVQKDMIISNICLRSKTGGKSGNYSL
jgi:cyclic pyranopterin phosphate synthase